MNIVRYTIGLSFFLLLNLSGFSQTQTVGTFINEEGVLDGYSLVSSLTSKNIYLIDNCGLKVHEWQTDNGTLVAYLQPNGDIVQAGVVQQAGSWGNGGQHGKLTRYSWSGTKLWSYTLADSNQILHHDIEILPNGNILAIAWKKIDRNKKIELGRDLDDPDLDSDLWDEVIYEFKPVGTNAVDIVWQWKVTDHLIQDLYSNKANYGVVANYPQKLNFNYAIQGTGLSSDWLHFNSIDYNETLDQILVSSLTTNEIYIIDHSTNTTQAGSGFGGNSGKGGDIIYRWGNPEAYNQGTDADKQSFGQHDPNWIMYGKYAGNIMFFNNRFGGNYTSVDILNLPFNGNNYSLDGSGKYGPNAPLYQFTTSAETDFFSAFMGAAEVLPNGNLYVTESTKGKLFEYDLENNKVVWSYVSPIRNTTMIKQGDSVYANVLFRSFKYPSDFDAFNGKTLTPGLPLETDPWPSDCNGIDTTTAKDTTDTKDTTETGGSASIASLYNNAITVYPNPSNGKLNIKAVNNVEGLRVYDLAGRVVAEQANIFSGETATFDLSVYADGVYYVGYRSNGYSHTNKVILSKNQ